MIGSSYYLSDLTGITLDKVLILIIESLSGRSVVSCLIDDKYLATRHGKLVFKRDMMFKTSDF